MKARSSGYERLVRARHRAAQAVLPLTAVAAGLAVTLAWVWRTHPSLAPVQDWRPLRPGWLAGLAVTILGAAALWRARRRALLRSAAEVDAVLAAHNRLETATALHEAQDALARAQRAETERFLERSRPAPRRSWLPSLSALTALLAAAHLATLVCWSRTVRPDAAAKRDAPAAQADNTRKAVPSAAIEWHSPEPETSATAIEEVPLEAEANSSSGLSEAVLEIEVNGEPRRSQPLPDDLTKPGAHLVKPSLYLDQLDVKTYDMVSYHLRAQRIWPAKLPPTVSPVQFVQVKPVREDTFICAGGDQPSKCFNYVTALKAAQLRLMKDNFTLAHAEVGHNHDEWQQENARVADAQKQLAARTEEVLALMTLNHYPEPILGLVRQSRPLMTDAAGKIGRQENQPALAPQGKALGYLTEVEKYLKNTIKLAGSNLQPRASDPFQRPKNLELKTRPLTRAAQIDKLAGEQARLAGDLASGNTNATLRLPAPDANSDAEELGGTPGQRQAELRQRIGELLEDAGVDPAALKHLQASHELAGQSQERIENRDLAGASEPAAEAARELRQTAAALREGGNQTAKDKLADALLQLAHASGTVRRAGQANSDAAAAEEIKKAEQAVREAAQGLAEEAQRQQENGATNAAARLGEMAQLLQGQSLRQMLAQAQQSPRDAAQAEALARRLDELAEQAGQQRNPGPPTRQELARLVQRLERTQANLKNLASHYGQPAAGQRDQPGQQPGAMPSAQAGQPSGVAPGAGTGSPGPEQQAAGPGAGKPAAPGPPNPQVAHARAEEPSRAELQAGEAEQLLDELRLGGMDTRCVPASTIYLARFDELLRQTAQRPVTRPQEFVPFVAQLEPPLTGLITALKTELAGMRRPFALELKDTAPAPPVYRAAVAEYFEQVSRDYQPAKDDAGKK